MLKIPAKLTRVCVAEHDGSVFFSYARPCALYRVIVCKVIEAPNSAESDELRYILGSYASAAHIMKARSFALAAAAAAVILAGATPAAFAQNSPGSPDSVLGDLSNTFQINQHPDMPFAASAPSAKYQHGDKSSMRKRGDNGDPDGCNLQCPSDNQ